MQLIPQNRTTTPRQVNEFRWKTQDGLTLKPSDMRTGHIFNSVVMLWHHFMPRDAQLWDHKRYSMGDRFTADYIETSLRVFLPELSARADLSQFQMRTLEKMAQYLKKRPTALPNTGRTRLSAA